MVTRTARLKDFKTDGYPGSGLPVQALAEDHVETYILPFPCEHINGEWRNATTGKASGQHPWVARGTGSGRDRMSPDQQPTKA